MSKLAPKENPDPPAEQPRGGYDPGRWPGAPVDKLPPECPVIPLGKDGDSTYFVDTLGQLRSVNVNKWGKKILMDLFADTPNYVTWAWPRLSAPKPDRPPQINGLEVDEACACLLKAAAGRGLFNTVDRVRGRGAWTVKSTGELIWHSGEALWKIEKGKLAVSRAGSEVDGAFYPRRPPVLVPWQAKVDVEDDDAPAPKLLEAFRAWQWERPALDPVLLLGWLGCAFLGGALPWRPTLFVTGDRGQGKSTLQGIIKEIVGDALHATADTTPAGIYQRVKQDTLPVAVDELEADPDNRRARGVIGLARLAASGAVMFRGGAEHEGVEFQARNTFFFSSINPPPLGPQDRSRMALLNLRKLDQGGKRPEIPGAIDAMGRMILRQLMDAWPRFDKTLDGWKDAMRGAGLDGRAQDTYGVLLATAELMLGSAALEDAGLPITEPEKLGAAIALATAGERAEQTDNWRACLEHLLQSTIDAWKGGEKPTIGAVVDQLERDEMVAHSAADLEQDAAGLARHKLAAAGLGTVMRKKLFPTQGGYLLAIPGNSPVLAKIFAGTIWAQGVWTHALKQAPAEIIIRDQGNKQVVKINRVATRCVLVDLKAYDAATEGER